MNTHGATVNRGEIVSMYAGLKITFSSDCEFCDKSTNIGTLAVLYI